MLLSLVNKLFEKVDRVAGWNDILIELMNTPSSSDIVRDKYLSKLADYTGRNVIAYYSGWLSFQAGDNLNLSINDLDMQGLMSAVQGLDCGKGLDLVLHTPGGSPTAAEAIVDYLKAKFGKDIRAIVPQLAMSAGTMIACSCKEIVMGKHSSIGPIDPQFGGIPAHNIENEFEEAKKDLEENPQNEGYWRIKLQQYPAAFLRTAKDAIALSDVLTKKWLKDNMFDEQTEQSNEIVDKIVTSLNSHGESLDHGRHYSMQTCIDLGLKIVQLESDDTLQDLVLSVHHSEMLALGSGITTKIIENHKGKRTIQTIQPS